MRVWGGNSSQPVRWLRKSKCHQERRNSESVACFRTIEACLCTTFSISRSSALRRSPAVISPFSSLARASLMRGGRNRLPTSSAREGGLVRCMVVNSREFNSMCGSARDAKEAFEHGGIGLQGSACRVVDDRAALQYHNTIGQPQNLLRILLDNDRTNAAGAGDGAERPQQLLDDDWRQTLGRLVQQQHFWVQRQRPADCQHLLLAAGELVAEIIATLPQAREHLVDFRHFPRSRLRHGPPLFFPPQPPQHISLLPH